MIELLTFGFMQRALVASVVVCTVAPLVGCFVVQRRQALIGEGMGHLAFAGVGLAFVLGVAPLLGALLLTLLAAVALARLTGANARGDLTLALLFYGGLASGYAFAARSGGGQTQVLGLLFGSPLNLTWGEVGAICGLASLVVLAVGLLYPQLVALAFDEAAARAAGVRTGGLVLALTVLVALVVVGGMSSLGLLLISAMMVLPVATAGLLAGSQRTTMLLAAALGGVSAAVGLVLSYLADLPSGATIVLVALGLHAGAVVLVPLRRVLRRSRARRPALAG